MQEKKESSAKERKGREGIPMSDESYKEWQQAFTDIDESIKVVMCTSENMKMKKKSSKH